MNEKFTDMALKFANLIRFIQMCTPDYCLVYFLHHVETAYDSMGVKKIKAKTIGKMLDEKYISSLFVRNCLNLKDIIYGGTLAEWSALLQLSHEWDVRFGGQFKTDLFDMYNVTVVCTDGSIVWQGELGVNPKYGV